MARADDDEPLRYRIYRTDGTGSMGGSGAAGTTSDEPPLLLLNGLMSSHHHWPFFVQHFRQRHPVIFWDYRGHGGMPPPRDRRSLTIEQLADDAHAVWAAAARRATAAGRAAAAAPAIACGLSFGVQVALELFRRHPGDVRALVLICGTYGHPLDRLSRAAGLRRALAASLRTAGRLGPLARLALGLGHTGLPRELAYLVGGAHRDLCPRELLDGILDHAASVAPQVFGETCASYFEHSARDLLPSIAVPTLIIAGDRDQLTPPRLAEEMHRTIPGSRLVVFPGHSHLVQLERPDAVHTAIDSFLDELGLRSKAAPG